MDWINKIKNYEPYDERELREKELILNAIEHYDDLLTRENPIMHMTSSCYIINKNKDKVLMIYHKIYNSWAWTGGHADGDGDFLHVAIKEAKEETGLKNIKVLTPEIFSMEVINVNGHIKRGKYVASHLHLNVTYILEADEKAELVVNKEETKGVKWIPMDKLDKYCTEEYIVNNIYNKLNSKIKEKLK